MVRLKFFYVYVLLSMVFNVFLLLPSGLLGKDYFKHDIGVVCRHICVYIYILYIMTIMYIPNYI